MMDNIIIWACSGAEYEEIKNNIVVRVVPSSVVSSDVCVFETIGDLAIVPAYVPNFDNIDNVYYISEKDFENWSVRRNIFFNTAIANTEKHFPLFLKKSPLDNIVNDIDTMAIYPESMPISTTLFNYKNGAISIFYPEVCKKISEKWNDSFYIVFISYDMCILHKFGTISIDEIKRHLKATNNAFLKDGKTLTNQVYYYDKSKEHIFMYKSEEYTKYLNLINDIDIGDCKCYYEYCSVYDVSEDIIDYIVDNIDDINYNNKHVFIEKLIELEKEV